MVEFQANRTHLKYSLEFRSLTSRLSVCKKGDFPGSTSFSAHVIFKLEFHSFRNCVKPCRPALISRVRLLEVLLVGTIKNEKGQCGHVFFGSLFWGFGPNFWSKDLKLNSARLTVKSPNNNSPQTNTQHNKLTFQTLFGRFNLTFFLRIKLGNKSAFRKSKNRN